MGLELSSYVTDSLPSTVKSALSKMSAEQQSLFYDEYKRKSKNLGLLMVLAIVFPIQLFLLGKTGLGLAFLFTMCGGGIWWVIEIFMTPKRVKEYNADVATTIVRDMKIMSS
jgi:hypothetical protein